MINLNNIHIIKLRGHHLLCIQGFQNKGYNDYFIENMASLISFLNNTKNVQVKILNSSDDICSFCPNLSKEGLCKDLSSNMSITKRDNLTLDFLGLQAGEIYPYLEILAKIL